MNVLIINPIIYTSETMNIKRAISIKDTMIYDLCLAFNENGHNVSLYAGEPFKPISTEQYPFSVVWGKCICKKVFQPNCFPLIPSIIKYLKQNLYELDLVICSEVFSVNTLAACRIIPKKVIIWHELSKHNSIFKQLPSKIWYNVVARVFMQKVCVVARSIEARSFVQKYCRNTQNQIIDHGVNLCKFPLSEVKNNYFIVCSQLIDRKKIDGILLKFSDYLNKFDADCKLIIVGEGELGNVLKEKASNLGIKDSVIFTGKLNHKELVPYVAHSLALLVNTNRDNNMISIIEAIAVATPIVTTEIPLNSTYIKDSKLGIADDNWNYISLHDIVRNNEIYVQNCIRYREDLSTGTKVNQFLSIFAR